MNKGASPDLPRERSDPSPFFPAQTASMTRRAVLALPAALAASCAGRGKEAAIPPGGGKKPRIAAIVTEYRHNSHAEMIVGRMLAGYEYEGAWREPSVRVTSLYADQVPANDMSRGMAARYGFVIHPTVRETLCSRGALDADGVVIVGEHGNYPSNEKGQHLYPRFELFSQAVECFRSAEKTVPVFCDKHLSWDWEKAKRMYDWSRELKFPLMAGSSLPLAWRIPPLELEPGTPVERAVVCFYGGKESYGFHALESLQCMVERRSGGETGIAAVQCIEGKRVWEWTDADPRMGRLLECALERCPDRKAGSPRSTVKEPVLFALEYRSGLRAAVYLLNGHIETTGFAADIQGETEPVSTQIWLQPARPFSHFSGLVHSIERMMVTGRPLWPVERTLLTTGALAALMDSSWKGGGRIETPHLAVRYKAPKGSFYSRGPVPKPE
jgi:hypothetical protein